MAGIAHRLNVRLAKAFPERRIFIRSDRGTRHLRLSPLAQLSIGAAVGLAGGWGVIATAAIMINLVSPDPRMSEAEVLREAYEARIAALTEERDRRALEAASAQSRFQTALAEISRQQTEILRGIEERQALETSLGLIREQMAAAIVQRDAALADVAHGQAQLAALRDSIAQGPGNGDVAETLDRITAALADAVRARDAAEARKAELEGQVAALDLRLRVSAERQDEMLEQLETTITGALAPLQELFRRADIDLDGVIATMRRNQSAGQGGPLQPAAISSRSFEESSLNNRLDDLLYDIDQLDLLRQAAMQMPFGEPVTARHRFTSGFGMRRHPISGRRTMHNGIDLAAPRGTPILATADGIVTSARYERGYGNTVRIRHAFGYETVYAHQNRLRVSAGERVSRGDRIGDMGTTGASTGVHLHYEIHLNGRPVDPMRYLEAARHVF